MSYPFTETSKIVLRDRAIRKVARGIVWSRAVKSKSHGAAINKIVAAGTTILKSIGPGKPGSLCWDKHLPSLRCN